MPAPAERPLDEAPDHRVVLHYEDRLAAAMKLMRHDGGRCRRLLLGTREVHRERTASSRLALDDDHPAALLHDPVHGRETEPRSPADLLGREKRLEQPLLDRPFK